MCKNSLLFLFLSVATVQGNTFFFKAMDFPVLEKKGVTIPAGEYYGWAWALKNAAVSIDFNGSKLISQKRATKISAKNPAPRFFWRRIGRVKISTGKLKITSSIKDGVACVCLSLNKDYDVQKTWSLIWTRAHDPSAVKDTRPSECRHINVAYKTWTYSSKDKWLKRARWLKDHILTSCGLLPPLTKTPLRATIFGRIERGSYSVEKVYFESWPGFYVTGNLYRPLGKKGPFPAVLCPHGHWGQGRFTNEGGARGGVPPRSIELAKLGCVAFSYDMVGFGDSKKQMNHTIAGLDNELWGTSLMKLQLWDSIRSVDFISSLKDVDPEKIACTGASGGGTQTFMLMSIDNRIKVAAPVCMVSAYMQGGCECENAPLLRLDTINCEIAALMAPRPLLLVSDTTDWTSHTPEVEYPMIKSIYKLFGAEDMVENAHFVAPHNYNKDSREAMYNFFLKHLLGKHPSKPHKESPFKIEKFKDLSVWAGRDLPSNMLDRKGIEILLKKEAQKRLESYMPKNKKLFARFKKVIGTAYKHTIYVKGRIKERKLNLKKLNKDLLLKTAALKNIRCIHMIFEEAGRKIPAVEYRSPGSTSDRKTALVIHPEGKAGLVDKNRGGPGRLVTSLLKRDFQVIAIDPFLTGEFNSSFKRTQRRHVDRMFYTYNRSTLVERVRDIVSVTKALLKSQGKGITLIGLENSGKWVTLAGPFLPETVSIIADLKGYKSGSEEMWHGDDFSPNILALGGIKTAASLCVPKYLTIFNADAGFDTKWPVSAYRANGAAGSLKLVGTDLSPEKISEIAAGYPK